MHVCLDKVTRVNNELMEILNGNFPVYGIYF